jgi:hypothetical protein
MSVVEETDHHPVKAHVFQQGNPKKQIHVKEEDLFGVVLGLYELPLFFDLALFLVKSDAE